MPRVYNTSLLSIFDQKEQREKDAQEYVDQLVEYFSRSSDELSKTSGGYINIDIKTRADSGLTFSLHVSIDNKKSFILCCDPYSCSYRMNNQKGDMQPLAQDPKKAACQLEQVIFSRLKPEVQKKLMSFASPASADCSI